MMVEIEDCAAFAGLAPHELVEGATPSILHRSLLCFYAQDLDALGAAAVRERIVADIRVSLDLEARRQAADLLIVLREFLFVCPQARLRGKSAAMA